MGYKQLLEVERGWRDLKTTLELRPVFHRKVERIRAHVQLCLLALLLIRVAETRSGQTWPALRAELQRLHAITYTGPAGTFRQTTTPSKAQRDILAALDVTRPRKVLDLATDRRPARTSPPRRRYGGWAPATWLAAPDR